MTNVYAMISGALAMGFWVAGMFFFRFWKKTRDRLFEIFGIAFWMMAVERLVLILFVTGPPTERHFLFYIPRLTAFLILLVAFVDKNRKAHDPRSSV